MKVVWEMKNIGRFCVFVIPHIEGKERNGCEKTGKLASG